MDSQQEETFCIVKFVGVDFAKVEQIFEAWLKKKESVRKQYQPRIARREVKQYMIECFENKKIEKPKKQPSPKPSNLVVIQPNIEPSTA